MTPVSCVRILFAPNVNEMHKLMDDYCTRNKNWEITSVSHCFVPNGISLAISLKYIGVDKNAFAMPLE